MLLLFAGTATCQEVCDSLDVVSVQYSPFTDTLIVVSVENNNLNEIFDYPGFVLITDNGDTLAKETVNYFGIGQQSMHYLSVRPGVVAPLEEFNGVLQLHTGFYAELACEWQLDRSFCTATDCDSIYLTFENYGGALVLGDFAWSLLDSNANVIESGTFTMEAQEQHWDKGFCLPKGSYSYTLMALGQPSGGGPTMTVSTAPLYGAPVIQQYFNWNTGNVLDIPLYLHCKNATGPNAIGSGPTDLSEIRVIRDGGRTMLQYNGSMSSVEIFGHDGRLVGTFSANGSGFVVPSSLANGVYLLRIETVKGIFTVKLYI